MSPGSATRALIIAALACGCEREAPGQPPGPGMAPAAPAAATALAKTFAAELVGNITPVAPVAGDYAMALTLSFETFVTTELRITDHRTGALQLTLARDGTAHACLGATHHQASAGQYHYVKDPAKRQHSESTDSQLNALAGTWKVVDGVAVIQLDRIAGATCDASKATVTIDTPVTELHCIGVAGSDRIPAGSLLCEATERSRLLDLAMPMTAASRKDVDGYPHAAPAGHDFVLGSPGVVVDVTETAQMHLPAITFHAGAAPLVETDYVKPR